MVILGSLVEDANNPQAYWWQVREAANCGYTVGWVEEASLEFVRLYTYPLFLPTRGQPQREGRRRARCAFDADRTAVRDDARLSDGQPQA